MKKICVVTGTRAEYGLLKWLLRELNNSEFFELQIMAVGPHLSHEFGLTKTEITRDGFRISKEVEMLLSSDTDIGSAKTIGLGVISTSDAFKDLNPDIVLLTGDRTEMMAASISAFILGIPIAHIHGGEKTVGAVDDVLRHCITKMSSLHFVAAEEYKKRVIQLGENPSRVQVVGGLGLDNIRRLELKSYSDLCVQFGLDQNSDIILVTYHPETHGEANVERSIKHLLRALQAFDNYNVVFTEPNSDVQGRLVKDEISHFCESTSNAKLLTSLGQLNYLSFLLQAKVVVGNSSSGIIEAPSLNTATVNIGTRQQGRLFAGSIISCGFEIKEIQEAIYRALSKEFSLLVPNTPNPYGEPGACEKIIKALESIEEGSLIKEEFFDL